MALRNLLAMLDVREMPRFICDITGSISFTWECTILLQIIKNSTTVNPSPGNNLLPFSSKAHKMPKVSKFYQTRII